MNLPQQIAAQFREVHLDGKWVVTTNLKAELSNLTWKQATTKIDSLHTIATLAFHINYYVAGILHVLEGGSLNIRDTYSFDHSPIESESDWKKLQHKIYNDAEKFASLVAQMPPEKLHEDFAGEKYGSYYKNIHALIAHIYYHLGQIILIKKMIKNSI